jgi:hypothetical protein
MRERIAPAYLVQAGLPQPSPHFEAAANIAAPFCIDHEYILSLSCAQS